MAPRRIGLRRPVDGDGTGDIGMIFKPLACIGTPRHDGKPFARGTINGGSHQPPSDPSATQALRNLGMHKDQTVAVEPVGQFDKRALGLDPFAHRKPTS